MKRPIILLTLMISFIIAGVLYFSQEDTLQESIIFFPLDESVMFTVADTTLSLIGKKDNDEYWLEWDVTSILDQEVYLRQDLSLLFSDGRLKAIISEWEDDSDKLAQYEKISGEDSSHFVAISFHHGEIHYNDSSIKSTHQMSTDHLYVIDSAFSSLQSFREPETTTHREWKDILDNVYEQQLTFTSDKLSSAFDISVNDYYQLTLTELANYNQDVLFELNRTQTQTLIGKLWEGLYKNYFLGIKKADGSIIDPIGSSEPILLLSKDFTHLYLLFETSDGESIQLIQRL